MKNDHPSHDPILTEYIGALCVDIKLFHMWKYFLSGWIAYSLEAEILYKHDLFVQSNVSLVITP